LVSNSSAVGAPLGCVDAAGDGACAWFAKTADPMTIAPAMPAALEARRPRIHGAITD
jgi:hypothetical protein